MARARSLSEFQKAFSDEASCVAFLFKRRWPDGFICPGCSERRNEFVFCLEEAYRIAKRNSGAAGNGIPLTSPCTSSKSCRIGQVAARRRADANVGADAGHDACAILFAPAPRRPRLRVHRQAGERLHARARNHITSFRLRLPAEKILQIRKTAPQLSAATIVKDGVTGLH